MAERVRLFKDVEAEVRTYWRTWLRHAAVAGGVALFGLAVTKTASDGSYDGLVTDRIQSSTAFIVFGLLAAVAVALQLAVRDRNDGARSIARAMALEGFAVLIAAAVIFVGALGAFYQFHPGPARIEVVAGIGAAVVFLVAVALDASTSTTDMKPVFATGYAAAVSPRFRAAAQRLRICYPTSRWAARLQAVGIIVSVASTAIAILLAWGVEGGAGVLISAGCVGLSVVAVALVQSSARSWLLGTSRFWWLGFVLLLPVAVAAWFLAKTYSADGVEFLTWFVRMMPIILLPAAITRPLLRIWYRRNLEWFRYWLTDFRPASAR